MARKVEKSNQCQNCHTPLSGENYCPECGQLNNVRKPTLASFIGESLSNFFAFDSKFFLSIYLLFRHPGKLAREYCDGKRMRYMAPIRLYFIASLIVLFLSSLDSSEDGIIHLKDSTTTQSDSLKTQESDTANADYERGRSLGSALASSDSLNSFSKMIRFARNSPDVDFQEFAQKSGVDDSWFNKSLYKLVVKAVKMEMDDFERFLDSKTFWILFFFLPIFAIWLKIIYIRRKIYYLEHLYFAFYTQSALFILISLAILLDLYAGFDMAVFFSLLAFAVYLFIALLSFYKQAIAKTIFKFIFLNVGFFFFAIFFMALAMLVTFIVF